MSNFKTVVGGVTYDLPEIPPYTGSTDTNADFPIGTCLWVFVNTAKAARCGTLVVRASDVNNFDYLEATYTGTLISGTWRVRGTFTTSVLTFYQLVERVA